MYMRKPAFYYFNIHFEWAIPFFINTGVWTTKVLKINMPWKE